MKSLFAAALAAALAGTPAAAQDASSDEALVVDVVQDFMTAFDAKDAEAMSGHITDDTAVFVIEERDADDRVQSLRMADLVAGIAGAPGEIAEPIEVTAVMVEGPVAMVWTEFGFYMDGALSHCGVNIFTLTRIEGDWKIATVTYSHIEDSCESAPRP